MPPRYAYWTIIVDGQPTAFRSGSLEDIQPTFNRLKAKNPTAELKWWQNNQLWPTRKDAQEFMQARGARGRERDPRQSSGDRPERAWNAKPDWKTRTSFSARGDKPSFSEGKPAWTPKGDAAPEGKPAWKPKGSFTPEPEKPKRSFAARDDRPDWKSTRSSSPKPQASSHERSDKPAYGKKSDGKQEWKPKGTFKPKEAGHASGWGERPGMKAERPSSPRPQASSHERSEKPTWKPKGSFAPHRPDWKPKSAGGSARDNARSSFRPKSYTPKVDDGMTRSSRVQSRNDKLEWQPKGSSSPKPQAPSPEGKRKWVPKAEYKKSLGIEVKRDDKWRPGGEHVDPKQKYKDAKKAKWTRVKATIRARSSKPRKP